LKKEILSSLVGLITIQASSFLTLAILSWVLTRNEFSLYGIFLSTVYLLGSVTVRTMSVAATKFTATTDRSKDRLINIAFIIKVNLILSVILSIFILIGGDAISIFMGYHDEAAYIIEPSVIPIIILAISSVLTGYLIGLKSNKEVALSRIIYGVIHLLLVCLGAYIYGKNGAIVGFIVANIINLIVLLKISKTKTLDFVNENCKSRKDIIDFSWPHALGVLVNQPVHWLTIMILGQADLESVAIFIIIDKLRQMLLFAPGALSQPFIPHLAIAIKDKRIIVKKILYKLIGLNITITTPIVIILYLFPDLFAIFFSKDLELHKYSEVILIILISGIVQVATVPLGDLITSNGDTKFGALAVLIKSTLLLTIFILNIENGLLALALAMMISNIAHFIILTAKTALILKSNNLNYE
jgi:O-antigen/teichoic acid export membrane protein